MEMKRNRGEVLSLRVAQAKLLTKGDPGGPVQGLRGGKIREKSTHLRGRRGQTPEVEPQKGHEHLPWLGPELCRDSGLMAVKEAGGAAGSGLRRSAIGRFRRLQYLLVLLLLEKAGGAARR